MKVRANFWIEKEGKVVLSVWRVRLLEAVDETGSISAAASQMGLTYRRAWEKIRESEERLGVALIETQSGGPGGGGTELTPLAKDYIDRFHKFTVGLNEIVRHRFEAHFLQEEQ